ncbi:MAG: hypothetical protein Q9227_007381 [Pyrenula ochraceoflavens]
MPHKTRKQRKAANPVQPQSTSRAASSSSTALTNADLLSPELSAYTKDLADWEAQNARCREIIMNTLIPGSEPWKIAEQFEKASDIWKALNDRYGNKNEPFPNMGLPGLDVPPPSLGAKTDPKTPQEKERIRKKAAQDAQQLKQELLEQVLAYDIDITGSAANDIEALEESRKRLEAMSKLSLSEQDSTAALKSVSDAALRSLSSVEAKANSGNAASRRRQNSRSQQKMTQFLSTLDSTLSKLTTIASSIAELQPGPALQSNHTTPSSLAPPPHMQPPSQPPPLLPPPPPLPSKEMPPPTLESKSATPQPSAKPRSPPQRHRSPEEARSSVSTAYPDPQTLAPSLFKFPDELARNKKFLLALLNGGNNEEETHSNQGPLEAAIG